MASLTYSMLAVLSRPFPSPPNSSMPHVLVPHRWLSPASKSEPPLALQSGRLNDDSALLCLPTEIRLRIAKMVLTQLRRSNKSGVSTMGRQYSYIDTSLLLVNRQLYSESYLISFQINEFAFQKWYGSGIFCCKNFLKSIRDWQAQAIRCVNLTIAERDLSGWHLAEGRLEICQVLGGDASAAGGLQSLTLEFEGQLLCHGEKLLNADAPWVADGLKKLKPLRKLVLIVRDDEVEQSLLVDFQSQLRQRLSKARVEVGRPSGENINDET